ncbi:arginine--tRNA ligase [Bacillus sp. AFS096315]|uniref:arginine--tRNA ligase n=1 Tax=Bacillus sp. AFS096315 TaxID=2033517 RepID=UPI000BEBA185|nr:arginine--tRNA ligase [Bacillus sp. AFS096315]PEC48051.1 arginine--tRNA ligase [Bacillus sp. AFS096315]
MNYVNMYSEQIEKALNGSLTLTEINSLIEKPHYADQGDLAFPCFQLAKALKKSPVIIAKEIAPQINHVLIEKVEANGPYVNCFLNKKLVSKQVIELVLGQGKAYGNRNQVIGEDKTVAIDCSSPNIAKPFSMGHLRSTMIGNSIAKIAEKNGYKSIKINHLGDWGTQFGKLIVAYKLWGNQDAVKENPIKELLKLYVKFHEEVEKEPQLEEEARSWFKQLEEKNEEALHLWKWFRDESLKEFMLVYDLLGVNFDSFNGEAFYNDKMERIIELLEQKNLLVESEGADVVELTEKELPPCLIRKSDGATLYATRDLAAALYRKETYDFDKAVYVVGGEQALHFDQVFTVLKKMGYEWANEMVHVPFGLILQNGKKMSTRKGKIVLLEEVIEEAISLASQNIAEKNPTLKNKEEVAKMVGVGAIIFQDLKNDRMNNIEFSLDQMLKFEGETGPYVQYSIARTNSILDKASSQALNKQDGLDDSYSWDIIKHILEFPNKVTRSFEQFEPSVIAKYTIDLAQSFNKYYGNTHILTTDDQLESRLALIKVVSIVLEEGLRLLGIRAPKEM